MVASRRPYAAVDRLASSAPPNLCAANLQTTPLIGFKEMTLKEELEILRGAPIEVFDGDPMDIPCIETSDAEKLCRNPVVSVHMITYNHEPYIRQAIEGVMMQKTDFEFELVIGEDCSQDRTREICFEYQNKYPDKIRVLWWHENVSKFGGNGRRVTAHCRGEFIAFCEGDDYWIDPLKLQKQVDVMRKYQDVGLCFGKSIIFWEDSREKEFWNGGHYIKGCISGKEFLELHAARWRIGNSKNYVMTATTLVRKSILNRCREMYDIFNWRLSLGDTTTWLAIATISGIYFLPEELSVYRRTCTGATVVFGNRILADGVIVRLYFLCKAGICDIPGNDWFDDTMASAVLNSQVMLSMRRQRENFIKVLNNRLLRRYFASGRNRLIAFLWRHGILSIKWNFILHWWLFHRHLTPKDNFVLGCKKAVKCLLRKISDRPRTVVEEARENLVLPPSAPEMSQGGGGGVIN